MKNTTTNTNATAVGKAAHTEGSWHIGLAATERAIYGQYGEHIATLPDMLASDEVTANARLIAAAPELLEALTDAADMLRLMGVDMKGHEMTRKIASAIARASGQGGGE